MDIGKEQEPVWVEPVPKENPAPEPEPVKEPVEEPEKVPA